MAATEQEAIAKPNGTTETTPLLHKVPDDLDKPKKWGKSVLYRCLLCAFLVSLSFGVTQVPLLYVFRVMTCDAYYDSHPEPPPGRDRCSNHEIESSTAKAFAIIGASTTLFGLVNLFVTGWTVKKIGVKYALMIQVFWPAIRLLVQNFGVMVGKNDGILIMQCSQIITIIGGPNGYLLALNSFVTEVVEGKERTGALGKLQGCMFLGTAMGYLAGGLISDAFGILAPFRVTLALFLSSTVYVFLFLPWLPPSKVEEKKASKGITRFFGPFKVFVPQKWVLQDGRIQRQYGALLLAIGVFFAILATGYIPILLQMYGTDIFGFGTKENGYLVSMNSFLRGAFLTMAFPRIIKAGRSWLSRREEARSTRTSEDSTPEGSINQALPTEPSQIEVGNPMDREEEPIKPPKPSDDRETFEFDLLYSKGSLLADGILTGAATWVNQGWQMYLVAALLPFAAGTGSAAKGTILQMCTTSERVDALSAITLVENMARLSTTGIFGLIFAAFADIGKTHLVFICNAAVALLGFLILLLSRFPPEGAERYHEDDNVLNAS